MKKWIIGGVVVALLLVVGGPFVYFNFVEGKAPAKLSISTATVPTTAAGTSGAARRNVEDRKRLNRAVPRQGDAVRAERYRGRQDE